LQVGELVDRVRIVDGERDEKVFEGYDEDDGGG